MTKKQMMQDMRKGRVQKAKPLSLLQLSWNSYVAGVLGGRFQRFVKAIDTSKLKPHLTALKRTDDSPPPAKALLMQQPGSTRDLVSDHE